MLVVDKTALTYAFIKPIFFGPFLKIAGFDEVSQPFERFGIIII